MESIAARIRQLKGGMSIPAFAKFIGEEKPQRLQDVLAERQRAPEDMLVPSCKRDMAIGLLWCARSEKSAYTATGALMAGNGS